MLQRQSQDTVDRQTKHDVFKSCYKVCLFVHQRRKWGEKIKGKISRQRYLRLPDARLPNGVVTKVRNAVRGAINKQVNKGHKSQSAVSTNEQSHTFVTADSGCSDPIENICKGKRSAFIKT